MQCNHKTSSDHMRHLGKDRYWSCTNCGKTEKWGTEWSNWSNIECVRCSQAAIDWVACSDKCADVLKGKKLNNK